MKILEFPVNPGNMNPPKKTATSKTKPPAHKWVFTSHFRSKAYSWKASVLAGKRIAEAVKEITKVSKVDPIVAGEGIVLFLERLVPSIEQIDSSSGSIGNSVNKGVEQLTKIFQSLAVEIPMRKAWLERIWDAFQEDGYGYLDQIGEAWGEMCGIPEIAGEYVDQFLPTLLMVWSQKTAGGYFQGSDACLSAMLAAGKHQELLDVLEKAPYVSWGYRKYGVQALVAMGKPDQAIAYAQASVGFNDSHNRMSAVCEEILISQGKWKEAYQEYGLYAEWSGSYLQRFRNLVKQYPMLVKEKILEDLINTSIEEDKGKWFATAKEIGDLELALSLCTHHACDPKTLNRAAKDFLESNPEFALGVALASLKWISKGFGYDLIGIDILQPVAIGLAAAQGLGKREEVKAEMIEIAKTDPHTWNFTKVYFALDSQ